MTDIILVGLAALLLGFVIGYVIRRMVAEARISSAEDEARRIVSQAEKEAESRRREAVLEAKESVHRVRSKAEDELRERRQELKQLEQRLMQKEETLEKKQESLETKNQDLKKAQARLETHRQEVEGLKEQHMNELERISGLDRELARTELMQRVEEETRQEAECVRREVEARVRAESDRTAKNVITLAIQRCAADHVAESTVSVVELPGDEMKGRIIGREGRNIRTFEALTGVDLIIDDTPEAVVISSFDPIRREKARLCLERLVADGRIHPARIEEMYGKAEAEIEAMMREEGEQAAYETRVHGIHPELVKLLGRLKFRSSYGQNVLKHSLEVAHLSGLMADELGLDCKVARRAGLLHDIGKAVDHEVEGTHVSIGVELLKKFRESRAVRDAMISHHGDVEPRSMEAVLVAAADALSAARPGARRETLEAYIKRLERLEEIADSFDGVDKAYAIQAGREIRILVKPDSIDDTAAHRMARNIVKEIERKLEYPGQIKVTVIRETRAVEYAR